MGPGGLRGIICDLRPSEDARRLVGFDLADDAGVFEIDGRALIQTIDVITPIVDDPYTFGRIAAANAISDVYSMGGVPITALNFLAFPEKQLSLAIAADILRGGMSACEEAGCALLGGHTVRDDEVKYGLAVTGIADPGEIMTNSGARAGDVLVLTKPIGTGIISTAVKRGKVSARSVEAAVSSMATLNRYACEAMMAVGANACTDVTGFGLCGHASQLAGASNVTFSIESSKIPLFPGVMALARKGMVPGGSRNNLAAYKDGVKVGNNVDETRLQVLFDAQTSGGLLISVDEGKAGKLVREMKRRNVPAARIIGRVSRRRKNTDLVIK